MPLCTAQAVLWNTGKANAEVEENQTDSCAVPCSSSWSETDAHYAPQTELSASLCPCRDINVYVKLYALFHYVLSYLEHSIIINTSECLVMKIHSSWSNQVQLLRIQKFLSTHPQISPYHLISTNTKIQKPNPPLYLTLHQCIFLQKLNVTLQKLF